jgi:hypothetical protein
MKRGFPISSILPFPAGITVFEKNISIIQESKRVSVFFPAP